MGWLTPYFRVGPQNVASGDNPSLSRAHCTPRPEILRCRRVVRRRVLHLLHCPESPLCGLDLPNLLRKRCKRRSPPFPRSVSSCKLRPVVLGGQQSRPSSAKVFHRFPQISTVYPRVILSAAVGVSSFSFAKLAAKLRALAPQPCRHGTLTPASVRTPRSLNDHPSHRVHPPHPRLTSWLLY